MSYYTQRNGLRKPVTKTYDIDHDKYAFLFTCCERYKKYLAWRWPVECPDGRGIIGLDENMFSMELHYEIPNLYRNENGKIVVPDKEEWWEEYDQYALLDYIELIAQQCRDIANECFHSYFVHYDMSFSNTCDIANKFIKEINDVFNKTGLLYKLNDLKQIERVIENDVIDKKVENDIEQIKEKGLKELLKDAVALYKSPYLQNNKNAVEKLWDAFERLKTYYVDLDKAKSADKIVNLISNGQQDFVDLFSKEFKELSSIGNNFRIRHHETNKVDIKDIRHYDYFFNRCLSIIALAIQYLE